MNIVSIGVLAVVAVIVALTLRPKNAEIALMLTVACAVLILLAVLSQAGQIIGTVNSIVAAAQINTGYIAILLKVVGICLLTEFAVNTCRDAGCQSLAGNVSLAGKLLVTVTALPLYTDILNTVIGLVP
ncbi:MAG: stage III sporulation protein AD [Ruminococcus sp.]|nr:SpoIIIAC/SpoIIIAD family protein [uncultured Ruminococcus sp.]MBQ1617156.1 stage III sporulation protein AD [Ruminococcus sp.]MBQ2470854.1 stage III sporulation protein AD [Ruminococcus sp.]MBQ4170435.1 stage III sporulation protein AD [Ruminococcus sp.]SCX24606.1 stage III sporulation protein AD [Ruminococcaceae bacterium P7]